MPFITLSPAYCLGIALPVGLHTCTPPPVLRKVSKKKDPPTSDTWALIPLLQGLPRIGISPGISWKEEKVRELAEQVKVIVIKFMT